MTAFLATAAIAGWIGFGLGFFVRGGCRDQQLAEAIVDRDLAHLDAVEAQREAAHWRARCAPTFSTGPGSPWQPADVEIERAAP